MDRLDDIKTFYGLLDQLAVCIGGAKCLMNCTGRDGWPERGVYFFFEDGEYRTDSGDGLRVVRVGTHCVSEGSKTKLWTRLSQHRGVQGGSGNHRASVFRSLVGDALRHSFPDIHTDSWSDHKAPRSLVKNAEHVMECRVSDHIGKMPFLWLAVDDPASKSSRRAYIERNTIALLSNYDKPAKVDAPSEYWLGVHSSSEKVRESGLWNSRHVDETYDRDFLDIFGDYIINGRISDL